MPYSIPDADLADDRLQSALWARSRHLVSSPSPQMGLGRVPGQRQPCRQLHAGALCRLMGMLCDVNARTDDIYFDHGYPSTVNR